MTRTLAPAAGAPTPALPLPVLSIAACAAIAVPSLLAFNVPPSSTFFNQAAALVGWGLFVMQCARLGALPARLNRAAAALLAALGLVIAAPLGWWWFGALPAPLALSSVGVVAAAALVALAAAAVARTPQREPVFTAVAVAFVVAGVLTLVVAFVQVFIPDWADGTWIASSAIEGRATGNLRQPNHLSSLLLWSIVGAVWLGQRGELHRGVAIALSLAFVAGLVLSASRTGVVGVMLLALWGAWEGGLAWLARRRRGGSGRLAPALAVALLLAPLAYWLLYRAFTWWAHSSHRVLAAEERFNRVGNLSSSRFAIWRDTLDLVAQHPWAGVGFGEFNFAWSLTPFPQRPTAFFDHTHNLPLQLVVEFGLPLALLVLGLLGFALWRAFVVGRDTPGPDGVLLRSAFMVVLLMALHSQLEYPLWYAYFLLPTAFVFGLCAGSDRERRTGEEPAAAPDERGGLRAWQRRLLPVGASLMMLGGAASVVDYWRVVAVFTEGGGPLAERIARGERSWFFAHHAHYAAVTTAEHPSQVMRSFEVAAYYLLDTRLMIAWANALAEAGDIERARHIAARLREFGNEDSTSFFAPCDDPAERVDPPPFQCTPPSRRMDYRDFK